jgi:hypothetical protein
MGTFAKSSARPRISEPERRLVAAVVLRAVRDLAVSNPRLRRQAVAFFDEEGLALAATLGVRPDRIRRVVTEVTGG